MSMLGEQASNLRLTADAITARGVTSGDIAILEIRLREAADTIESLRDRLQASEDAVQSVKWAELQSQLAEAERKAAMFERVAEDQKARNRDMRSTVNAVTGADANSRWHELFGTPERAAETMFTLMLNCARGDGPCERCPAYPRCNWASDDGDENESIMLEWLKGDAE